MTSKFFILILFFLSSFHVQTHIQLLSDLIPSKLSEQTQFSLDSFEYTLPVEVSKRHLQIVPIAPQQTTKTNLSTIFSGLILYHNLPQTFALGQIFQVRGKITIPSYKSNTHVTFCFVYKANITLRYSYAVTISPGNFEFSINVDTRSVPAGDYYVGLYTGTKLIYNPTVKYTLKRMVTENSNIQAPLTPSGCSLQFSNDKLTLKWKEDTTPIKRVTFRQNNKNVEYFLSNFVSYFDIIFQDFVDFANGTVQLTVQSAFSASNSLTDRISAYSDPWTYSFVACSQNFSFVSPKITLTQELPWIVPVGTNITIQGTSTVKLSKDMKMQESSQFSISTYEILTADSLSPSSLYKFSEKISLLKSGTYILQMNDINGQCLMNRPIYVGSFLPLIPDFSDRVALQQPEKIHEMLSHQPKTVNQIREILLHHINEKRLSWGRGPLMMVENLNDLAQSHSNDMVAKNYISDINKDGLSPQDRANRAGVNCTVSQVVTSNMDIVLAHNLMCRTPSNLEIIVRESFTQIGLGVARNAQGYMYITQLFAVPMDTLSGSNDLSPPAMDLNIMSMRELSANGLTCAQTEALKIQVRDWILVNYRVREDIVLSRIVQKWLCSKNEDTIFDYTWNTARYPANYLSGTYVIAPYSESFTSGFKQSLFLKRPDISYSRFGIGVMQQPNGKVKVYVEYAK